MATTITVET